MSLQIILSYQKFSPLNPVEYNILYTIVETKCGVLVIIT